jgi:hypothetical protein
MAIESEVCFELPRNAERTYTYVICSALIFLPPATAAKPPRPTIRRTQVAGSGTPVVAMKPPGVLL